jgi:magnesium transporter
MITCFDTIAKTQIPISLEAPALPPAANWIDAFRPDAAEIAFLKRALGVEPPTYERLSEIENSSRLYAVGDRLYLSTPMIYQDESGIVRATPLGFVVGKDRLLTVHFEPIAACDFKRLSGQSGDRPSSGGYGALLAILDSIVDYLADELEMLTNQLDAYSHIIFRHDDRRPRRGDGDDSGVRSLRRVLRNLGRVGGHASRIGESLLGISRMAPFVIHMAGETLSPEARAKLKTIARDVSSLTDYERHLSDKIQFLLDATLGMISVDQNDTFKVLTLVSVVGIPPTLIASMYGMNFKNMPELDWTYGYPYGLVLIALSALIPLAWFKWRGWF